MPAHTHVRSRLGAWLRRSGLVPTVALFVALAPTPARAGGWAAQPSPNAPGWPFTALNGVSCPSPTACIAVGNTRFSGAITALAGIDEYWNSANWNLTFGQRLLGNANNVLTSVSCVSATDCEAVGYSVDSTGTEFALAEGWNGSGWSAQLVSEEPDSTLNGVSCTSASACAAVGYYADADGIQRPLFASWDGTSWQFPPGFEAAHSWLNAVACQRRHHLPSGRGKRWWRRGISVCRAVERHRLELRDPRSQLHLELPHCCVMPILWLLRRRRKRHRPRRSAALIRRALARRQSMATAEHAEPQR
jgi:hypothetical protein